MFSKMLGQRLEQIYSVVMILEAERYRVEHTLVFRLSTGNIYQLLVSQDDQTLRQMSNETDLILWGEYEDDLEIVLEPIESDVLLFEKSLLIGEIKEYWAECQQEFLMGVVFADPESGKQLSILAGGTEVEVVTPELFMTATKGTGFPIRTVQLVAPPTTEGPTSVISD